MAEKLDALLLSSDGAVRKFASKRGVERHGMFWIFDRLIEQELLIKSYAATLLNSLFKNNLMYKHNGNLWKEAEKRINRWKEV